MCWHNTHAVKCSHFVLFSFKLSFEYHWNAYNFEILLKIVVLDNVTIGWNMVCVIGLRPTNDFRTHTGT